MLIKLQKELFQIAKNKVKIKKYINSKDVTRHSAFKDGEKLKIVLELPEILGDGGAVIRIHKDFGESFDIPMNFKDSDHSIDTYVGIIELKYGLYYWEILILRGQDTLFTSSINNVDFELKDKSENQFMLSVYKRDEKEIALNNWFEGKIMYQIFVDRFYKGDNIKNEDIPLKKGAYLEKDWYKDDLEYAEISGGKIKNNRFYGGNLYGIADKLKYLKSLNVGVIYLNPIFKSSSNHRYDTGDYEKIDEMIFGEEAFCELVKKADKLGIKIILDGVFNHTGSDSRYFNKYNNYEEKGAYKNKDSLYRNWYSFSENDDKYECWWNIDIMPRLNHNCLSCRKYFTGEDGIGAKYIKMGAKGFRLDVADELSDDFLDEFKTSLKKASDSESIVIGEVWENAADKMAYGKRRRYFLDGQLDSVMNYPLRNGLIEFCCFGNGDALYNTLTEIYSCYPYFVSNKLMNILGTHDTERILTVLSIGSKGDRLELEKALQMTNKEKDEFSPTKEQRDLGKKLLKMASIIQFTVYGVPCIYYGDEIASYGFGDPFCRKTYKWGREDKDLLSHYKKLSKIRSENNVFAQGDFFCEKLDENTLKIIRKDENEEILIFALSHGKSDFVSVNFKGEYENLFTKKIYKNTALLENNSALVLKKI